MTVTNTNNKDVFVGDDATLIFAYTFRIFAASDLVVTISDTSVIPQVDTLLVLSSDYTVDGVGSPSGGNVTLLLTGQLSVPPTTTDNITLLREEPLTQNLDFIENDNFPSQSTEDALDKLTFIVQQLQEQVARSLNIPPNITGVSVDLPSPVADNFFAWDPTATFLINAGSAAQVAADAAAAAASAAAAAASETAASSSASSASSSESAAAASAAAAAASQAALALPTPVFPANEGDILVARAAASPDSYALEIQGVATIVDDFTIINPGGIVQTAPFILDNIMLNALQIAEGQSLSIGGMVDGVRDSFNDETGIDLGASSDQVFEGGSYRTPIVFTLGDTKLLLNATAYNNALAVLDSSGQDHVITSVGDATLSPNFFMFGNGALCLNGIDQAVTLADSPDWDVFNVATQDYTIDVWIRHSSPISIDNYIFQHRTDASNRWFFGNFIGSGLQFFVISGGGIRVNAKSDNKINDNNWHHIAMTKIGAATAEFAIWEDGFQVGYDTSSDTASFTGVLEIGKNVAAGFFSGYMDDLRITNNNAFSASPIPHPLLNFHLDDNLVNTVVIDSGSGGNAGTLNGGANTDAVHSDGKVVFSFDFDGFDDSIAVNAIAASINSDTTGTIIGWINPDVIGSEMTVFSIGDFSANTSAVFKVNSAGNISFIEIEVGATVIDITSGATVSANVWTQVAIVQDGVAAVLYINGVADSAVASTGGTQWFSSLSAIDRVNIAGNASNASVTQFFDGRLDDIRYYQNVDLTQTQIESIRQAGLVGIYGLGSPNITVPTSAHTDSVNTFLLLPFDTTTQGQDLIDISTGGAGSPHTVTSIAGAGVTGKFGNAYLTFDGTGDHLTIPDSASLDLGILDFSISTWVRSKVDGTVEYFFHKRTGASSGELEFFKNASDQLVLSTDNGSAVVATSTATLADRNWHFLLGVRVGTDLGVYLDTAQIAFATGTAENMDSTGSLFIGANTALTLFHNGDLDDYHVNTGNPLSATPVVGLTDTITIPTIQTVVDGNSVLLINANTQDESLSIQIPLFNNGASITSAQSQFGGFSYAFDGTNDTIRVDTSNDWNIVRTSKLDQTIQFFVRHTDHAGTEVYMTNVNDVNNNWRIEHVDGSGIRFVVTQAGGIIIVLPFAGEITDSIFHHVLLSIVGSESGLGALFGMYLDGTQISFSQDNSIVELSAPLFLGSDGLGGDFLDGNMDGIEIVENNIFSALPNPGLTDTITVPIVAPAVDSTIGVMTLRSIAVDVAPALPAPDTIKFYIDIEDISPTVIPNVDFRGRASRDGGTTFSLFTASAFVQTGQATNGRRLYVYDVDVSGQPDPGAGLSDIVVEAETLNNIQMRFHAWSELWG